MRGAGFIVVYVHQPRDDSIQGFYLWHNIANLHWHVLVQCRDPPVGYLEIQYTATKDIILYDRSNGEYDSKMLMKTIVKTC